MTFFEIMLSSITKSQQLLELLEAEIASGKFEGDQAIPSQTEMAKMYGVSVATVREALSALSQQGLIEKIHGRGAFLTDKAIYGEAAVKHGILAVMFEQLPNNSPRNLPFYQPVLEGMETMARKSGVDICLCPSRSDELPRLIRERKVDGVIMIGHAPDNIKRIQETASGIPVVAFHAFSEITHCVMSDDYDGGRQATQHLLDLGHRKIAYLGVHDLEKRPGKLRIQGYLDTMREHKILVPDEWIEQDLWMPSPTSLLPCSGCDKCAACIGWQTMKSKNGITSETRQLPFTALICHSDAVAMGVISQAQADGFAVPRDFSVLGFDNVSRDYHFKPQITSIDLSLRHLGEEAVRLLCGILDDAEKDNAASDAKQEYSHPTIPVHLAIHQTTDFPPGDESSRRISDNQFQPEAKTLQAVLA